MSGMTHPGLTVGQAARAAGLTRKAVRLYEARGLLSPAKRSSAGYRLYDDSDIELLIFIRRARALDMSLADISTVLAAREVGGPPCEVVRGLLDARVADIDTTIDELLRLRATLIACRHLAETGADEATAVCPIIEGHEATVGDARTCYRGSGRGGPVQSDCAPA